MKSGAGLTVRAAAYKTAHFEDTPRPALAISSGRFGSRWRPGPVKDQEPMSGNRPPTSAENGSCQTATAKQRNTGSTRTERITPIAHAGSGSLGMGRLAPYVAGHIL